MGRAGEAAGLRSVQAAGAGRRASDLGAATRWERGSSPSWPVSGRQDASHKGPGAPWATAPERQACKSPQAFTGAATRHAQLEPGPDMSHVFN